MSELKDPTKLAFYRHLADNKYAPNFRIYITFFRTINNLSLYFKSTVPFASEYRTPPLI
jgi:hypothetical protein